MNEQLKTAASGFLSKLGYPVFSPNKNNAIMALSGFAQSLIDNGVLVEAEQYKQVATAYGILTGIIHDKSTVSSAGKEVVAPTVEDIETFLYSGVDDHEDVPMTAIQLHDWFAQFKSYPASNDGKNLSGEFKVIDGKLSFTCHTSNIEYSEVLKGITLLRDELNRQINNQSNCPYHEAPASTIKVVSDEEIWLECERYVQPNPDEDDDFYSDLNVIQACRRVGLHIGQWYRKQLTDK